MTLPPPMRSGGGGVSLELLALLSAVGAAVLSALAIAKHPPRTSPKADASTPEEQDRDHAVDKLPP